MSGAAHDFAGRRLLGVFAHPDDESLAAGGLLAWCAALGAHVSLLCLSRGEAGPGGDHSTLGSTRTRELHAAAGALGIDTVVVLDHADGMLPWLPAGVLSADVRRTITDERPDVVVTFDEDGLYWHPDHVATHHATRTAVASFGVQAPALYYVTTPSGQMRRLVDTVGARMPATASRAVLGIADPDAFGASAPPPTMVVHAGRFARQKLAALRCHRTQVAGGPFDHVDALEADTLLGVEHYRRADVGSQAPAFVERLAAPPLEPS
jgi:N-acetyl-1-D-myo-inositol-2-amino-2-deoxy-alpha-D-glucopyranoside deacetylase